MERRKSLISRFYVEYIFPKNLLRLVFVIIGAISASLLQTALPYYLKVIIDFAEQKELQGFLSSVKIFGVLAFNLVVIMYLYGNQLEWIKVKVKEKVRTDILSKLHSIAYTDVISNSHGAYLQRIIDDVDKVDSLILTAYLQLGIFMLIAIFSLIIMIKLSWQLTLASVVVLPVYFLLTYIYQRKAVPLTYRQQNAYQNVVAFADESLKCTYTIRNQGATFRVLEKFKEIYAKYVESYLSLFKVNYFYGNVLNTLLSVLVQFIVIGFGAYLILRGKLTTGTVIGFLVYADLIRLPLDYILVFSTKIQPSKVSLQRIYTILDKPSVYEIKHIVYGNEGDAVIALEVNNLSFGYDGNPVLENVNFNVKKGEWVCIVGESGSGKSTLLNVLLKHFPVPDNTVFIFGKDLNKYTAAEVLGLITLIEQEPQLFSEMSVLENLTIGVDKSVKEIEEIARNMGMGDILSKIPLDRKVLLQSAGLSGGEKKRLSILRGLLRDTPIVILDEPTAFVDKESGIAVLENLKKNLKDRTVIITTHDREVLKFCDRIIDLQEVKKQL